MRLSPGFLASSLFCLTVIQAVPAQRGRFPNSDAITAERLRDHLEFIASDEMEGRDTPSRGLDIAALYIATQLKLWGVKPMGDNGGYFQHYGVTRPHVDAKATTLTIGGKTRVYGVDFYGQTNGSGSASGGLVFVGEGWVIPRLNLNPYDKIDVKGKIVLINGSRPSGFNRDDFRGQNGSMNAYNAAQANGALAVIVLPHGTSADIWPEMAEASVKTGSPRAEFQAPQQGIPAVVASKALADEILAGEPFRADQIAKNADDGKSVFFSLATGKTVDLSVQVAQERLETENVVGMVQGSDPKLSVEFVAMSAHLDHLGLQAGNPPKVFNGADDDGSGTVSILELAHAFATGKNHPRRSMLFIWHSGEEKGLWGSAYYANHPTVDLKNLITDLNIDMIGRTRAPGDTNKLNAVLTGPDEIYVVGSSMISPQLGDVCREVNKRLYNLSYNYKYDDPKDTERIYFRSDHYNYAAKGIPIAFFFDGVHEDYHRVTDKVEKIDFGKMEKVVRTVYGIAWTLGNAKDRPVLKVPSP